MKISRREWFKTASSAAGVAAGSALLGVSVPLAQAEQAKDAQSPLPPAFDKLKPLGDRVKPITAEEFQARISHAQKLMTDARPRFDALYISPGTSLAYFTGIHWNLSERIVALLLPRTGEPLLICPGFEEGRLRELLKWDIPVRTWQEDENPHALGRRLACGARRSLRQRGYRGNHALRVLRRASPLGSGARVRERGSHHRGLPRAKERA